MTNVEDRVTIIETSMGLQLKNLDTKIDSLLECQKDMSKEFQAYLLKMQTEGCYSLNSLKKDVITNKDWIRGNGNEGAKVKIAKLSKNMNWTNKLLVGVFLAIISLILKSFF